MAHASRFGRNPKYCLMSLRLIFSNELHGLAFTLWLHPSDSPVRHSTRVVSARTAQIYMYSGCALKDRLPIRSILASNIVQYGVFQGSNTQFWYAFRPSALIYVHYTKGRAHPFIHHYRSHFSPDRITLLAYFTRVAPLRVDYQSDDVPRPCVPVITIGYNEADGRTSY